jgi:hypothetical protein
MHVHPTSAIAASAPERQFGDRYNRLQRRFECVVIGARNGCGLEGHLGPAPISSWRA